MKSEAHAQKEKHADHIVTTTHYWLVFIKGSIADLTPEIITSTSTTSARAWKPKWKPT
jgi:hypothetical protein